MSEYMAQELSAPEGLPEKSQFFRPRTKGRMAFSAALLSGVSSAQSRYRTSFGHSFSV